MTITSCLYKGWVSHQRYQPKPHAFRYHLSLVYLDLDELPELFDPYWYCSYGRWNIASFQRRDYLFPEAPSLKAAIQHFVKEGCGLETKGPVRLLTHLRYWGYCFNPVSFYYLFDETDSYIQAIVAAVTNTPWGECHAYLLYDINQQGIQRHYHFEVDKALHVSPFLTMDYRYHFYFAKPGSRLTVFMENWQADERHFTATLSLKQEPLNRHSLRKLLWGTLPMTFKVISTIYWQALRLYLKGIPLITHPGSKQ